VKPEPVDLNEFDHDSFFIDYDMANPISTVN